MVAKMVSEVLVVTGHHHISSYLGVSRDYFLSMPPMAEAAQQADLSWTSKILLFWWLETFIFSISGNGT
jgi:hypothetical protein